jgi:TPP-dependent indolepyruvate ferredoxin oxidoreductase alpha subunit
MGGGAGSPGGAGGLHQWQPVRDPPAKATRTITTMRRIFFIATSLSVDLVAVTDYTTHEEARSKNEPYLCPLCTFRPFCRFSQNAKSPTSFEVGLFNKIPCGDLLSHTVTRAVPSALRGLTSVFGMGTGVALSALPQRNSYATCANLSFTIASWICRFAAGSLGSGGGEPPPSQ